MSFPPLVSTNLAASTPSLMQRMTKDFSADSSDDPFTPLEESSSDNNLLKSVRFREDDEDEELFLGHQKNGFLPSIMSHKPMNANGGGILNGISTIVNIDNFDPETGGRKILGANRGVEAYYKHLDRFHVPRTKSWANLQRTNQSSGRPKILKPLKLIEHGREKSTWLFGNPWAVTEPRVIKETSVTSDEGSSNRYSADSIESIQLGTSKHPSANILHHHRSNWTGHPSRRKDLMASAAAEFSDKTSSTDDTITPPNHKLNVVPPLKAQSLLNINKNNNLRNSREILNKKSKLSESREHLNKQPPPPSPKKKKDKRKLPGVHNNNNNKLLTNENKLINSAAINNNNAQLPPKPPVIKKPLKPRRRRWKKQEVTPPILAMTNGIDRELSENEAAETLEGVFLEYLAKSSDVQDNDSVSSSRIHEGTIENRSLDNAVNGGSVHNLSRRESLMNSLNQSIASRKSSAVYSSDDDQSNFEQSQKSFYSQMSQQSEKSYTSQISKHSQTSKHSQISDHSQTSMHSQISDHSQKSYASQLSQESQMSKMSNTSRLSDTSKKSQQSQMSESNKSRLSTASKKSQESETPDKSRLSATSQKSTLSQESEKSQNLNYSQDSKDEEEEEALPESPTGSNRAVSSTSSQLTVRSKSPESPRTSDVPNDAILQFAQDQSRVDPL